MADLQQQVRSYLETLGFNFLEWSEGFLVADRVDFGGARDTRLIWIPPTVEEPEGDITHIERDLVRQFYEETRRYPEARCWVIAHTFGGFSQEFRAEASRYNVLLRVPVQFFDTPFKYEEAPNVLSAIKELRSPEARIPQPYSILVNGEPQGGGDDLLEQLLDEFQLYKQPMLRIVVGPAGIGKTWLFRSLFYHLYNKRFLDRKSRLETFPRPIPFIPSYLRQAGALRTQDLFRSFVESEVASPVPQKTFEWMLTQGYASWLFDGLDELYMGDPDFFDILAELLTRPDSRAQILVCARESLLTTCETFSEFLRDYGADPTVRIYRLEEWNHQSKRTFAGFHFNPPKDELFVRYISSSHSLRSLSGLPYYCELLRMVFEQGKSEDFADDFTLIDYAVSQIIEREKEKGLLRLEDFVPNGLYDWLEAVASEFFAGYFRGVEKADVETYAESVLREDLSEDERRNAVTTLVQFPLFAPGTEPGRIAFEHELIAEYLAGRYWFRRLLDEPVRVSRGLGKRPDFADSLIARYLSSKLAENPQGIKKLEEVLSRALTDDIAFVNLLQLLLLANPARDALAALKSSMEGHDLSHVRFVGRDLTECSFRNCNLSNSVFRDCDLRGAHFEGAHLAGTRFEKLGRENLEGAQFGDLVHFEYAYVDKSHFDEHSTFAEWVRKMTGKREPILEPCPSAIQLRTLFLKFVWPNGSGRRDELPRRALTRGRRHPEAPEPEEFIEASIKFGYLQELGWHNRIRRVPGDRYDEMVNFVTDWRLSANLKKLLDAVCPEIGCEHVPQRE